MLHDTSGGSSSMGNGEFQMASRVAVAASEKTMKPEHGHKGMRNCTRKLHACACMATLTD